MKLTINARYCDFRPRDAADVTETGEKPSQGSNEDEQINTIRRFLPQVKIAFFLRTGICRLYSVTRSINLFGYADLSQGNKLFMSVYKLVILTEQNITILKCSVNFL